MTDASKPELLIITNYFPPEIGAASNRIFHLADGLKLDYKVRVVTPLPNYPTGKIFSSYRNKMFTKTIENGIEVHRLWIYASASKNAFLRLIAMLSYSCSLAIYFLTHKKPKKIIIQSPPLLVSFTSLLFLRSKKRTLILNISDLWPRAGLELGALKKNKLYSILKRIERFNYFNADIILGQSNEIIEHVKMINPKATTLLYRNYPVVKWHQLEEKGSSNDRLKIVYAGLVGVAQGIMKLCQNLNYNNIEFHIYGSGAEEKDIIDYIRQNPKLPIFFHGKLERSNLHNSLKNHDVAIIPLIKRIYGSVPSKIFEFSQLGLPLLYFGGGEGEAIINQYELGWVADAGNYEDLNRTIATIRNKDISLINRQRIQTTARNEFNFEAQLKVLKQFL